MLKSDPSSEKAQAFAKALLEKMDLSELPEELCIVIGGDGYLLSVIAEEGPLFRNHRQQIAITTDDNAQLFRQLGEVHLLEKGFGEGLCLFRTGIRLEHLATQSIAWWRQGAYLYCK